MATGVWTELASHKRLCNKPTVSVLKAVIHFCMHVFNLCTALSVVGALPVFYSLS